MNTHVVGAAADATPLLVLPSADFESWREAQTEEIGSWLGDSGFAGKAGTWCWLPGSSNRPERVLAMVRDFGPTCIGHLPLALPEGSYTLEFGAHESDALESDADGDSDAAVANAKRCALAWGLGAYQFTRYKAASRAPAELVTSAANAVNPTLDAIYLVRDLINTPTNDMLPDHLESSVVGLAAEFGAECRTVTGDDLLTDNYPTIHAVGRASASPPRLIELTWGDAKAPELTLIGKGVCFDSGGLDVKSAAGMRLMKKDMGGAAHAIGLARLVMSQRLAVRLRLLVPAVENAIAGNAYRPGDILTTRKGLTVEIDNTDAEGRLVLCDALALAEEANPDLMIDFATLTGAARVALGPDVPAMFSNDDPTAEGIAEAALAESDPVWRMPLHRPYKKMLETKVADLVNSAASPLGGAITAALFLESFVDETPWVHFDVMAWNASDRRGRPRGGEAMGLRAVYAYLDQRYGSEPTS